MITSIKRWIDRSFVKTATGEFLPDPIGERVHADYYDWATNSFTVPYSISATYNMREMEAMAKRVSMGLASTGSIIQGLKPGKSIQYHKKWTACDYCGATNIDKRGRCTCCGADR
jgi:hypothetical protein